MKIKESPNIVAIDYLQLIDSGERQKSRNGEVDTARLRWKPEIQRIENMSKYF